MSVKWRANEVSINCVEEVQVRSKELGGRKSVGLWMRRNEHEKLKREVEVLTKGENCIQNIL